MKLGTLIDTLEQMPQDYLVHYDNGMVPGYFATWRGVYAEVTLCPQPYDPWADLSDEERRET